MFVAVNDYCLTDKLLDMKNGIVLVAILLMCACSDSAIKKPEKPIDEQTMTAIIYDLSVLDGMKARNPALTTSASSAYIYKKYNIDSLQFAQNSQYYSADIDKYKKIYENVSERLATEKIAADSLAKKSGEKVDKVSIPNDDTPRIE